jgi:hypothetical protein
MPQETTAMTEHEWLACSDPATLTPAFDCGLEIDERRLPCRKGRRVMGRVLAFAPVFFCFLGCHSKPNQVHFIISDGFRGAFAVKPDDPDGIELVKEDGRYNVRIPEGGVLRIKGYNPFHVFLSKASFANGEEIWVEKRLDDRPRKDQVGLWGGITEIEPIYRYWWFIGTEEEWTTRGMKSIDQAR